ncbi:unnamed protein product [Adineta ricciae]|uniref:Uncharacterized protein n=1 Tax=Adineta ricciae TaxID=249248 RepID=A0A813PCA1_ADIRI|nr:unnamed protein product [Adineta ricciae]CAF1497912.1 unnamed protein product [Adineta ricciae]
MAETEYFPSAEPVKGYDYYHRRKSTTSKCTQTGIYPDVLDCSLFHYCHQNKQHEVFQCPDGLHFDPKLFMCSPKQLVNCQYEPPMDMDNTPMIKSNTICRDYVSGTHLPAANRLDEFVVCEDDGTSTVKKCQPGLRYNALTTKCEKQPCDVDSDLCHNHGQCVNELTSTKGFRCICSLSYQGEHCDKPVQVTNTPDTSTQYLFRYTNRITNYQKSLPTTAKPPPAVSIDSSHDSEELPTIESPLSRIFRRLNSNLDQQQRVNELTQVIFIIIFALIGLILLASMVFGVIVCMRMLLFSPVENVGTWKVLPDEWKV